MGLSILFPTVIVACLAAFLGNASYPPYQSCSAYTCNGSLVKYPFNNCGSISSFQCSENESPLINITSLSGFCSGERLRVLGGITESSYTSRTIRIACDNLYDDCSASEYFYFSDDNNLHLSDKYKWGSILICETQSSYSNILQSIKCLDCRNRHDLCFFLPSQLSTSVHHDNCTGHYGVIIPGDSNYNITDEKNLRELLHTGFEVYWNTSAACVSCEASRGICYTPYSTQQFSACICPDGPHKYNCTDGKLLYQKKWWVNSKYEAAIGVLLGVFITSIIIFIYVRVDRKKREQRKEEQEIRRYMDPLDSRPASVENFLHGGIPTSYSYRQIKKYTRNFSDRVGQGGFGTVFKGTLPNGCMVAIKILDNSKHSRSQFMNEVATIGRIHHMHLVQLLGYCFERSKRALVYEYMVNGSLEKYIYGDDQNILDWKQLYSIAMGVARGIAYLHDDCRSKILHCDIKPHNILLDADFSPKVADFGLAKLGDREDSHVSLTGARGTPGYVAPEVWSRSKGSVTEKSDVYSYGMLVMEMVGGRKNLDMKATRSSKFYYPEWAFKQVEMGEFRKLRGENIEDDQDEGVAKKLSMLGLWCIQYNPSQRPPMSRVLQMLEGTIDIIIPPHPFPVNTPVQTIASAESPSIM